MARFLSSLFCFFSTFWLAAIPLFAVSTTIVISQVYGGGGNSGATYTNDFVELHNISSAPVTISGWSVQYAAATGNSWASTNLTGTIPSGAYFLVQEASGGSNGTTNPTPDATGTINLSSTAGKVALVNTTTVLTSTSGSSGSTIVDFVGYGSSANLHEGSGPAPAPSNTTSIQRANQGSTDTDSNSADFSAGSVTSPGPRNSASATFLPTPVATQVDVETAPDGTGTAVGRRTLTVGSALTVYAVSRSASNVYVANVAGTWSLVNDSGIASGDLVASADEKSAVFTPHSSGSTQIQATSGSLTATPSGVLTVNPAQAMPTGVGASSVARVAANQSTELTVTVTPAGNPPSTGVTVTADLSAFGGSATTQLYDDGTHGDATAGDGIYSLGLTIPANQTGGATSVPVTITDAQGRSSTSTITFQVLGSFTIFHSNDCHARITPHMWQIPQHGPVDNPFEAVGGAAYMAGEILSLTSSNPQALVLDGGDISEGNPIGDINGNQGVVGFFQLLSQKLKAQTARGGRGIDAFVVGNHDVRDIRYINNLANQTDFPVISMNVVKHGTLMPYFPAYVTQVVNGTKIGIIGYTTESSTVGPTLTSTIDIAHCDWSSSDTTKIHLSDYVNTLRNSLGCDVVILLTHDGHSDLCTPDTSGSTPVLADTTAAKIPEIAITGHWHTWCDSVWQPQILNYKTIFMESASYIKYVGELNVTGAGKYVSSVQHVLEDSAITPDPDILNYVNNEITAYNTSSPPPTYQANQVLGYTADDLLLDKKMKWWSSDEYPWNGDNTAGEFICDGTQWAGSQASVTWSGTQPSGPADMSMEVGGGVRSDIPAGPMTFTQIYEMFPWDDDLLYIVKMSGQEIWNFIQSNNCDVGISHDWHVTAVNGIISGITYQGNPIDLAHIYNVAINSYMYENNTFSDKNPSTSTYLCRNALMDYAQQFPQTSPYQVGGMRYTVNTDFSGGYTAVVTMMNDADSSPTFDDAFIRLTGTTPETLARRGSYQVPTSLVNADGTINRANPLAEIEMYRSYLGFKTGALKPGDIIQTYGKGGFYDGDPEFVDQEGIYADGVEFNVIGHDASLAQPEYYAHIADFYNTNLLNHYVVFYAKKTGASTVVDANNTPLSVMDVTAYNSKTLPGNVGDLLQLTGITTSETSSFALRFRCDSAVEASSVGVYGYPPSSKVNATPTGTQTAPIQLTTTAMATNGSGISVVDLAPEADAQVTQGNPNNNYGSTTNIYVQSSASGPYQNERGWLKFDLSSLAGSAITSAQLRMYCWKTAGASLPAGAYSASDSWNESTLTWGNQPTFNSPALSTTTFNAGSTNVWYSWDITSYVQTQIGATDKTASLLVKAVTEDSTDTTPPAYTFDTKEYGASTAPVLEVDTQTQAGSLAIAQVQYFYRYSADGTTWGAWTAYQTATTAPYTVTFNYPSGAGYYQFYSVATDTAGTVEPAPTLADTSVTYNTATTPATDTPTVPPWGLVLLGGVLALFAANNLRTKMRLPLMFALATGILLLLVATSSRADATRHVAVNPALSSSPRSKH